MALSDYVRVMADRPDRLCVPIEIELLPLHREPPGTARLWRDERREQRRERRRERQSRRRPQRLLGRVTTRAKAVTGRLRRSK